MTRTAGVIPARWASTRFPGKVLAPLCGKPLIQWVWERARQAEELTDLLIATDDPRVMDVCHAFGAQTIMTRADHPSGTDRVAEAIGALDAELVVNVQGDEPLIDPSLISRMARTLAADPQWDMVTAAVPIASIEECNKIDVVKVVRGRDGGALFFSRLPIPYIRDEAGADFPLHWRHIGVYGYRRSCLTELVAASPCAIERAERLEQLRALYLGFQMKVLDVERATVGVDTPEDVPRAERALREAGLA